MTPRTLLNSAFRAIAVAALLGCSFGSQAQEQCGPANADGIQQCRTGLAPQDVQRMAAVQERSNWCWAASVSMIFAFHGHSLSQDRIAREQYADAANRGVEASDITRLLGHGWQDVHGRAFFATAHAGREPGRRFQFGNDTVIRELIAQRPLLIGTLSHAMVLVAVEYERFTFQDAVRITGGTVIDPWPRQGVRPLRPAELRPSYVTAVRMGGTVTEVASTAPQAIASTVALSAL